VLDAADYGVPQNRKRAILLASRVGTVAPPAPTHSRTGHDDLFGAGRQRWVTMAEALGWAPGGAYDDSGQNSTLGGGRTERYIRSSDRPAGTVGTMVVGQWKLAYPGRSYDAAPLTRPLDAPAPTVALGHNVASWCWERPATTVVGTFGGGSHIAPPGHHGKSTYTEGSGAVPVTLEELSVLQDFAPDHPWRGNKSEIARQIGNAIPPGLAAAALSSVLGRAKVRAAS
jgi:DNA (cytosine-5)-methyltransferase 1